MLDERPPDITSSRNRWIKLARSLHRRRQRYSERAILVEGVRPVQEALSAGVVFRAALLSGDVPAGSPPYELARKIADSHSRLFSVQPDVFRSASDTETPQGILAICDLPAESPLHPLDHPPMLLIVDQVRDPGNLGTLLRSALGASVDAVLIGPKSADPYSPKVLRAGAGSHFRLPIAFLDWSNPPEILADCTILVADAGSDIAYDEIDWTRPSAVVIGNETSGPSEAVFQRVHGTVGIPLANSLESLNAGIAGSVILFESWRQRRSSGRGLSRTYADFQVES